MSTVASTLSQTKFATRDFTPTNADNMIYYSEDYPADYVIGFDGEYLISFPDVPVGAEIVRVDLEIKTLKLTEWVWNGATRVLILGGNHLGTILDPWGFPTSEGQLVSIIYKIKKTTL